MQLRPTELLTAASPDAPARRTFAPRHPRVRGQAVAAIGAVALGATTALFGAAAPANAAMVPTISAPAITNGWAPSRSRARPTRAPVSSSGRARTSTG